MRLSILFFGISFLWLSAWVSMCPGQSDDGAHESLAAATQSVGAPVFDKADVPSSERSRAVVARVAPKLATELEDAGLSYGAPVFMRVLKEEGELEVWVKGEDRFVLFGTYEIAAWSGDLGPKLREGDLQAPEGFYFVTPGRMNPYSQFHRSVPYVRRVPQNSRALRLIVFQQPATITCINGR